MKKIFVSIALYSLFIYKASAWVYMYVDFCNNTPFQTSYDLNFNKNEFSNNNRFGFPRSGTIQPGQCASGNGDINTSWWASSDNTTFEDDTLSFSFAGHNFELFNPAGYYLQVMCSGLFANVMLVDPTPNNFHLELVLNYDSFTGKKYISADNPLTGKSLSWGATCPAN